MVQYLYRSVYRIHPRRIHDRFFQFLGAMAGWNPIIELDLAILSEGACHRDAPSEVWNSV